MTVLPESATLCTCSGRAPALARASPTRPLMVASAMALSFRTPSFSAQTMRLITSSPQAAWRLWPEAAACTRPSAMSTR